MLKIISILLLLISTLGALPRFALQEGSSCNLCHVNPSGGGLRNDYGISVASNEISRSEGGSLVSNYTGMINQYLRVGGDIRLMNYNTFETSLFKSALFPMQAEIAGHWQIHERFSLVVKQDVLRNQNKAWVLWTGLPFNGYLKAGKDIPNYGLKLDDHTSFIRGGNINNKMLQYEGLIFSPYLLSPGMIEYGININNLYISQSVANRFIKKASTGGFDEFLHDKAFTTRIEWRPSFFNINGHLGGSYLQQGVIRFSGIYGGIAFKKLSWMGEVDMAEEYASTGTTLASYSEFVYHFVKGCDVLLKYDFFDGDIDTLGRAIQRVTIGLEIFPVPFIEIRCQVRFTDYKGSDAALKEEFIIQLHTWF